MTNKEYSLELGGATITAKFTDITERANGSVILSSGETVVMATAVLGQNEREGIDYFPLMVDYEEKFYAVGQILGGRFMKREGRPSDEAILSGRVVDRTIRPLFDQRMRNEVQVVVMILSVGSYDPDTLAVNAASLALATSDIPWNGPVGSVRIIMDEKTNELIINPTYSLRDENGKALDLLCCGQNGEINMIEVSAKEASEDTISKAFEKALPEIEKLEKFQKEIVSEIGKKKLDIVLPEISSALKEKWKESIEPKLKEAVFSGIAGDETVSVLRKEWREIVAEALLDENSNQIEELFENMVDEELHRGALYDNARSDNRKMDEVRELNAEVATISNIVHGSGLFYRGGTHVLSILTLGGPEDSQIIDGMEVQKKKRFLHHYNFPPFSVGETGRMGGTNRRMIGHGTLAEKALFPVIPSQEKFPYTVRIVSEVMSSNGSSSMGSVCGGTLALMDGGVPIKAPVAGIAMGLILDSSDKNKYKILTDIQGPEDHYGDMDFKVAGTEEGVTAIQLDVKVGGIPVKILSEALSDAKNARLKILEVIKSVIPAPREKLSPNAPEILSIKIKPEQIGGVIGSGGKVINGIKEETGVLAIDIEDNGTVIITGKGGSSGKAKEIIELLTKEYKVGELVTGEVVKIVDFGAFVKISPNVEGLVHISEISPNRIEKIEGILNVGDKVPVIIKEIDERGRIKLSIKDARGKSNNTAGQ